MRITRYILLSAFICGYVVSYSQTIRREPKTTDRVARLLSQLSLDEKINLCAGVTSAEAFAGVKRLGIPQVLCTDGPRGPNRAGTVTAFPTGICFGASWDPSLVEAANRVIGQETRAKGIGVLLGPGVNILRDPLNGRFFEYYTEDPLLNSALTVAAVNGIQEEGVAACLKHYACNNREDNRNFYMSMVDERTLHEIYLPTFKAAVQKGHLLTIMTSANGVNGEFVSDSKYLLTDVLKNSWGFDGFVLTDWLQTRSTEKAALAGLDISMPGGDDCGFGKPLLDAVKQGRVPVSVIDDKVRRILGVYERLGYLDSVPKRNKSAVNTIAHQKIAQQVAEQGLVLLKNQHQVLPFNEGKMRHVLVIGPNADKKLCFPGAGGSSGISGPYEITALKGIQDLLGADKVTYLSSEDLGGFQPVPASAIRQNDGGNGFSAAYFAEGYQQAVVNRVDSTLDFMWEMKSPDPRIDPKAFQKATYEASLIPPMDGKYTLRLIVNGVAHMYHNAGQGEQLAFADSRQTLTIANAAVTLKKGVPYPIHIAYEKMPGDAAIRLEWELPEAPAEKLARVEQAARDADAVVYVAGIDHSMDTEGRDRHDMNFPGAQENMINRLANLNKNLAVVLINGSPLQLGGWLPNVPAVVEAWYPGMNGGTAIANVLFGKVNPSGKLPFSWPKNLADVPCKRLATQNDDFVDYTDSLMVGYRYYDTQKQQPEFPFGFGLSYTQFGYGNVSVRKINNGALVHVSLRNTGQREGGEVVQVYVRPLKPHVQRPVHELKAFKKVFLAKGAAQQLSFQLDANAFSYYDVRRHSWRVDHGPYVIEVGSSSRDIRSTQQINL